jgi:hypothetical protein
LMSSDASFTDSAERASSQSRITVLSAQHSLTQPLDF